MNLRTSLQPIRVATLMVVAGACCWTVGCGGPDGFEGTPDGDVQDVDGAQDVKTDTSWHVDAGKDASTVDGGADARTDSVPDDVQGDVPDDVQGDVPDAESDADPDVVLDAESDAVPDQQVPTSVGLLVVDSNRNGKLEPTNAEEMKNKATWNKDFGAVFLVNIDDDDGDGSVDHSDEVLNGAEDVKDLARFEVVAASGDVPKTYTGKLSVDAASASKVRIFRVKGAEFVSQKDPQNIVLTSQDLAEGVQFAIEGRSFVMSKKEGEWAGYVDLTHVVTAGGKEIAHDVARMRVAPLVFMNNLMKTEKVWAAGYDKWFINDMRAGLQAASVPLDVLFYVGYKEPDQWTQDHFEMGYVSMPAEGGAHTIKVAMRTPTPIREAADIVFREFLGPDFGAIHVRSAKYNEWMSTYDSMGNWDTVPPHTANGVSYSHGRFIVGSTKSTYPDPVAIGFVEAQAIQPIIKVDTSWLSVGHVDEFSSFVKASTPRGWRMLFARPALAVQMLQQLQDDGYGAVKMHVGKKWYGDDPWEVWAADISIDEVLADADIMATNQADQATLNGILAKLTTELALDESEITFMPFLEYEDPYYGGSVAYQPGTVNLLHVDGHLLIADPFGPKVGGVDVFKKDLDDRLGSLGLSNHYVDDWDTYHAWMGEVHCGSNTLRVVSEKDAAWWEDGR